MVHKKLDGSTDLDQYLEDMLEVQRRQTKKLEKQFKENNEAWKEFKQVNDEEIRNFESKNVQDDIDEIKQINVNLE